MNNVLRRFYDASAEDMMYGIGTIDLGAGPPAPIICIQYRDWSREKLDVVRESFKSGIILTCSEHKPGVHHIHLATRETITVEHVEGGHTSVLRAPAWDAHLEHIENSAFRVLEDCRRQRGGFLLLTQAGGGEFMAAVDEIRQKTVVGDLRPDSATIGPMTDHKRKTR